MEEGSSRSAKHVGVVQAGGGGELGVNRSSKATWRLSALPHLLNESKPSEMERSPGAQSPPEAGRDVLQRGRAEV